MLSHKIKKYQPVSIAGYIIVTISCTFHTEKSYKSREIYDSNNKHNHYSSLTVIDTNIVTQLYTLK